MTSAQPPHCSLSGFEGEPRPGLGRYKIVCPGQDKRSGFHRLHGFWSRQTRVRMCWRRQRCLASRTHAGVPRRMSWNQKSRSKGQMRCGFQPSTNVRHSGVNLNGNARSSGSGKAERLTRKCSSAEGEEVLNNSNREAIPKTKCSRQCKSCGRRTRRCCTYDRSLKKTQRCGSPPACQSPSGGSPVKRQISTGGLRLTYSPTRPLPPPDPASPEIEAQPLACAGEDPDMQSTGSFAAHNDSGFQQQSCSKEDNNSPQTMYHNVSTCGVENQVFEVHQVISGVASDTENSWLIPKQLRKENTERQKAQSLLKVLMNSQHKLVATHNKRLSRKTPKKSGNSVNNNSPQQASRVIPSYPKPNVNDWPSLVKLDRPKGLIKEAAMEMVRNKQTGSLSCNAMKLLAGNASMEHGVAFKRQTSGSTIMEHGVALKRQTSGSTIMEHGVAFKRQTAGSTIMEHGVAFKRQTSGSTIMTGPQGMSLNTKPKSWAAVAACPLTYRLLGEQRISTLSCLQQTLQPPSIRVSTDGNTAKETTSNDLCDSISEIAAVNTPLQYDLHEAPSCGVPEDPTSEPFKCILNGADSIRGNHARPDKNVEQKSLFWYKKRTQRVNQMILLTGCRDVGNTQRFSKKDSVRDKKRSDFGKKKASICRRNGDWRMDDPHRPTIGDFIVSEQQAECKADCDKSFVFEKTLHTFKGLSCTNTKTNYPFKHAPFENCKLYNWLQNSPKDTDEVTQVQQKKISVRYRALLRNQADRLGSKAVNLTQCLHRETKETQGYQCVQPTDNHHLGSLGIQTESNSFFQSGTNQFQSKSQFDSRDAQIGSQQFDRRSVKGHKSGTNNTQEVASPLDELKATGTLFGTGTVVSHHAAGQVPVSLSESAAASLVL